VEKNEKLLQLTPLRREDSIEPKFKKGVPHYDERTPIIGRFGVGRVSMSCFTFSHALENVPIAANSF
jgi:hypothetical protein